MAFHAANHDSAVSKWGSKWGPSHPPMEAKWTVSVKPISSNSCILDRMHSKSSGPWSIVAVGGGDDDDDDDDDVCSNDDDDDDDVVVVLVLVFVGGFKLKKAQMTTLTPS
mmetsp:Transcript_52626/g.79866  ORF Transcript_52626/g.79866 Transcript_52626/m.79866 type:complete len:110 (-) Transcript_52626:162-491(-)